MAFDFIEIQKSWQQFSPETRIDFHRQVTVLTGANGAGKTTLLRFLARHFGFTYHSLLTPGIEEEQGLRYHARRLLRFLGYREKEHPAEIGRIGYEGGTESPLRVPVTAESAEYHPTIDSPQQVLGFFLPSHRPEFRYQRVAQISLETKAWEREAFDSVHNAIKSVAKGGHSHPVSFRMKEVLICLGIFGSGGGAIRPDLRASELFEGFQEVLRDVLPSTLGFHRLEIRDRTEIVLLTDSGEFLLDAVSGGIAAVFELAWLIYMYSEDVDDRFTVVIDEPENHLHPAMQRSLLPAFVAAFPQVQFILATHSPFIVNSVRDAAVYALTFEPDGTVRSQLLDFADRSGTAEEILADVLGVAVTMPIWAERELSSVVQELSSLSLEPETARLLRARLKDRGLQHYLPFAMARLDDEAYR